MNPITHLPSPDQIQTFALLRRWYGIRHYTMEEVDTAWMTVIRIKEPDGLD